MPTRQKKQNAETGCAVCNPALEPKNNTDAIMKSMRQHWKAGARTPQFQKLVLDDYPDCTPAEFTHAAWNLYREMDGAAKEFSRHIVATATPDLDAEIPF